MNQDQDRRRPEHRTLRKTIADHLRRSRSLRHVEPDLAREHRVLAELYKRHIAIEMEFGRVKSQCMFRAVGLTLLRRRRKP